ncbi:SEC-C domain-containing protein [Rhodococcus sp. IEGM 1401]|uniref:SEC-C domain-containing protein n=1 Tax=unclassified Rhodococcus (in: high G+C Gram-positive bacteria) TaxID=192944 RepID=UPI0022B34520|nr:MULTISPECIES: SEC-C domain-containing protein [unclassified Rhodococcus (in: high G+C Gram-positive bacteria)]MCZ4563397.1 SEC-C domain-containing protein [Rhodococcus sp. IEGM 1401]MDI9923520.1 SEC-C domain-containing protein [Rhodococcus sp. IEGM 1372]MDV8036010.1 SEC-C domain-containing protein [Rhodococcus sp. IEGM 1414]
MDGNDEYDELDTAALDVLRELGPLSTEDWAIAMSDRRFGHRREMYDLVYTIDSIDLAFLPDMRNIAVDRLLEGRVLTHRLTEQEVASDIIDSMDDLSPITTLLQFADDPAGLRTKYRGIGDGGAFTGRGIDDPQWPPSEALVLPPGTLSDYERGDVVSLVVMDGVVSIRLVDGPLEQIDVTAAVREIVPEDESVDRDAVVYQLMYDHPDLFTRPGPPLSEIFAGAGIDQSEDQVARTGFDFDAAAATTRTNIVANTLGVDTEEARALVLFGDIVRDIRGEIADDAQQHSEAAVSEGADALIPLARSDVAVLALNRHFDSKGTAEALLQAAEALLSAGPRRATAAAHWFRATALDRLGDALSAETALEKALDADSHFEPAVLALAEYASTRGDAVRGLSLLGRIDSDAGADLREMLEPYVPQDRPDLGRNERCWCDSGRKYKVCHLGKNVLSLEERAQWLYQKAGGYAVTANSADLILGLARIRTEHLGDGDDVLSKAFEEPMVSDVVLFEGGKFAEFVSSHGPLLPADELMLAQQWLLVERSIHEIESVRPGEGLSLRDIRTGDRHAVTERSASRELTAGQFICSRVVPVGGQFQIFGGIEPVDPTQRTKLIEILDADPVDPEDLVSFLSARLAPLRIETRDGDPVALCESVFELGEVDGLRRRLSRKFGAAEGNRWHWKVGTSILGTLTLDGTRLTVEAMSERRVDTLIDDVITLHPDADQLSDRRSSAEEAMVERSGKSTEPVEMTPELIGLLDEQIREYERKWLTESIPALDGWTPRDAAADPTRRDDLIRLLDSLPGEERPGAMSVRRLRDMLDL